MDSITALAASGLRSRMESLEMLANNIANAGTQGYKADREFYGLYQSELDEQAAQGTTMPNIQHAWIDFSQGTLQATGNGTDLALQGSGFFTVAGPSGNLYTRNGSFHLSTTGTLETAEGYDVLDRGGKPIQLDAAKSFSVDSAGIIRQGGEDVAELGVVEFKSPNTMSKVGRNLFRQTDTKDKPTLATSTQVVQGQVETSNVSPADGAVRLVSVTRQYEMLQKAVTLTGEMNRHAIEEVAKVQV
jgi:flagellar basal-body rod protein FlgF